jgi:type III pantothenate kinase
MIIVADAGNTSISLGVFKDKTLAANFKLSTQEYHSGDELGVLMVESFKKNGLEDLLLEFSGGIISSVAEHVTKPLKEAMKKYLNIHPMVLDSQLESGVLLKIDNPLEVGSDRIANAVAGYEVYKKALVVIDFGTATTFCSISSKGEFQGGAICPGIHMVLQALHQKTSKLPEVRLKKPNKFIGTNTEDNILSGVFWGHVGQVEYILKGIKEEMGEQPLVVATGGLSHLIAESIEGIDVVRESLTLEGLKIIYDRQREK